MLGADGIEQLKNRIINIICDVVENDLRNSHYYLISPDDVNDTIGKNIIDEAIEELKEECELPQTVKVCGFAADELIKIRLRNIWLPSWTSCGVRNDDSKLT